MIIRFKLTLLILLLFMGCQQEELAGVANSELLVIGDRHYTELVSLVPHPKGGFLVGLNTRINTERQMAVRKYDEHFDLEWERVIGEGLDTRLLKIFIDKDEQILVCGLSYGIGQDHWPLTSHKLWMPFVELLLMDGSTKWAYPMFAAVDFPSGDGDVERISDIVQDENGDYIIGGEFSTRGSGVSTALIKLMSTGDSVLAFNPVRNVKGKAEAIFTGDKFPLLLHYYQDSLNAPGSLIFSRFQLHPFAQSWFHHYQTSWPRSDVYENGHISGIKHETEDGIGQYYYFFPDALYKVQTDKLGENISSDFITEDLTGIQEVTKTLDNHFLIGHEDGTFLETDFDLKELNRFQIEWPYNEFCKLHNGQYVVALQDDRFINLLRLSEEGETIHE